MFRALELCRTYYDIREEDDKWEKKVQLKDNYPYDDNYYIFPLPSKNHIKGFYQPHQRYVIFMVKRCFGSYILSFSRSSVCPGTEDLTVHQHTASCTGEGGVLGAESETISTVRSSL